MSRIGITCPLAHSHLNNMLLLGRTLQARGHSVTVFHVPDMRAKVEDAGVTFCEIGAVQFPLGWLAEVDRTVSGLRGLQALKVGIANITRFCDVICREVPAAAANMDLLLVDQEEPAGGSVADRLGIPFVTVSNALAINTEPGVPPIYMNWQYRDATWARARNWLCHRIAARLTRSIRDAINTHRRQWGLPPQAGVDDSFSKVAQISQQPPVFDFPRRTLPQSFHYVGPLRGPGTQDAPFPWEKLNGRKLIYASLGTLLSGRLEVFQQIAEACADLAAQLVISHVGCLSPDQVALLSRHALVVPYAPQYELLKHAHLTITHGGLNTVLDSLSHGVPVVALPCMNDAFGVGTRLEWTGAGRTLPWSKLRADRLRAVVHDVFTNPRYTEAAHLIQESIRSAGGLPAAVEIIERVVRTHARSQRAQSAAL